MSTTRRARPARPLLALSLLAVVLVGSTAPTSARADDDPLDVADAPTSVRRHVFRAEAALRRDENAEAVRILQDALRDDDDADHPAVLYRLGVYLLELDRPADAVPHLRRATELAPESLPCWAEYARAAYATGAYADAAAAFTRAHAVADDPDPLLRYYAGVAWVLADRPARAVDELAPLVASSLDTVPVEWVQALVSAAAAAEQPARADAGVRRLLREHADRPAAWSLASQQAQLTGDLSAAALRLQVADWLGDLGPADVRQLADLYGAAGLPRQAARTYQRLWPARPDLARQLAVSWLQAHEPDSARVVLREALGVGRGGGDGGGGDGGGGAPASRDADRDADDAAQLWMLLGDVEYTRDQHAAARAAYAEAASRDPSRARAWLMQGAASIELDDAAAAREALARASEFDATRSEARRLLAHLDRTAARARDGGPDLEQGGDPDGQRGGDRRGDRGDG